MKKTFLIIIAAGISSISAIGQQGRLQLPMDYVQNSITGKNNVPVNVLGSPYLDEKFKPGTVRIKDADSYQAYMRYNAYHDEIEMQENPKPVALMKRDYVTARIGADQFKVVSYQVGSSNRQGYMIVLKEGATSFYLKNEVILKEGKEASSSYSQDQPPKFEANQKYYLAFDNGIAKEVKLNKKGILSALPSKQKVAEKFVKDNKLNLKSSEQVIRLLAFLDEEIKS